MRFLSRAALTAFALLACAFLPAPASARGLDAYDVKFENGKQLEQLAHQGFDMTEARRGSTVEIIATTKQARQLRALGLRRGARRPAASPHPSASRAQRADGSWDVYRPYFDDTYVGTATTDAPGHERKTIYKELSRLAPDHQDLVKPVRLGTTINGKPLIAFKVTKTHARSRMASVPRRSTRRPSSA